MVIRKTANLDSIFKNQISNLVKCGLEAAKYMDRENLLRNRPLSQIAGSLCEWEWENIPNIFSITQTTNYAAFMLF